MKGGGKLLLGENTLCLVPAVAFLNLEGSLMRPLAGPIRASVAIFSGGLTFYVRKKMQVSS